MSRLLLASLVLGALALVGCGSDSGQPVPTKEDFAKTAPPANWRGPGQPGAPGGAPAAGGQGSNPGSGPPPGYKPPATGG